MVISYVIPAQLTGDYIQDIPIFRISPIFDNLIKQIKETDKLVTFENEMLCEGKKIYYEARVKSLLKNQAIIIIRDITENKIADEQKQFIENARLKTNFMSKVSHELRTPLTAMNEGIYLVFNEEVGKLNEQQKQLLSLVHRNLNRLSRLIDDVLYLQRMDSGKMEFIFKPTDINNVIMEVIETMCQSFVNKGLYLKSDLAAGLPKVKLDRDRIIQVVTNLINNAFKFTEQGGVLITSEATPQGVMIKVHDTGIGIRHEDVNRLFQSFEQLNTFERKSTGTGLGLVICKEILDHHGGKIWIESKYSKGSTFLFTLNAWQD
jgi:signal transduction histidine kinase